MASLQSKGTYWQACFRDSSGKQVQRSTKIQVHGANRSDSESLKRKAGIVANKMEMAARGEIGNASHFRKTLEDLLTLSGSSSVETLGSWSKAWLERSKGRYGSSTYSTCELIMRGLSAQIGQASALESILPEQIQLYIDTRAKIRAAATVSKERKLMSKCFSDAVRAGVISKNPVSATYAPKLASTEREAFTETEVASMLSRADSEWKNAINCAAMTGLRLRDCLSLGAEHYDKTLDAIKITEAKTGKPLVIPVNATLRKILKAERIAPTLSGMSNGAINKRFIKVMEAAKIDRGASKSSESAKNTTYRKSFHSLRHTFVSRLTNAGVDPEIRQKLAGHSSVEVHEIYVHHNIERLRDAIQRI